MSELKGLKRKLGVIKSAITKFANLTGENMNLGELQAKLSNLDDLFRKFEELFFKLLEERNEGHEEEEERIYSEYQDKVYKAKGKLLEQVRVMEAAVGNFKNDKNLTENNRNSGQENVGVRIPKVDISKFSGRLEEWLKFHETFKAIIHNNGKLLNIQKFHYLVSCLVGEAAQVIDGIEISDSNYEFAWDKLENHYKNNKLLTEIHLGNLFEAKKLENQSSKDLRELHNIFINNLNSLKKLNIKPENSDAFLVYLFSSKLDSVTLKAWEKESAAFKEMPKFEELEEFIARQYTSLESFEIKMGTLNKGNNIKAKKHTTALITQTEKANLCRICKSQNHPVYKCKQFLQSSVENRRDMVNKVGCCWQCLSTLHKVADCSGRLCSKCSGKHNYLLCKSSKPDEYKKVVGGKTQGSVQKKEEQHGSSSASALCGSRGNEIFQTQRARVIFPLVLAKIKDRNGQWLTGRFLLDSGSELSFISESLYKKLKLPFEANKLQIHGIGNSKTKSLGFITTNIKSRVSDFCRELQFYIIPEVAARVNSVSSVELTKLNVPSRIINNLADPNFNNSLDKIDGILSARVFFEVLGKEKFYPDINIGGKVPCFINTAFGWVICGEYSEIIKWPEGNSCLVSTWPGEENSVVVDSILSKKGLRREEDRLCETWFQNSSRVHSDGKFIVSLPLKRDAKVLGNSLSGSMKRFLNLEVKLAKDRKLKEEYRKFIHEYLELGHMEPVPFQELDKQPNYYLPHHAVIKESTTTGLRVVFDASFKASSGLSLNNILYTGPALQNDIFEILLTFRTPRYALTADVAKMYRQIWIEPNQMDLQRILWRDNQDESISHFRLKTVTYGTSPAPFLAIRCLHQIAEDIKLQEPNIADIILNNFFMDDLLTGADTVEELIYIQNKLEDNLKSRGLVLRKWCSNADELMETLSSNIEQHYAVNLAKGDTIKTLGLSWNPKSDNLILTLHPWKTTNVTKRVILADLQGFWDPLGLLSPILIKGKIYLQELWRIKLTWDEILPKDLANKWLRFRESLVKMQAVTIPRRVFPENCINFELQGFSDASEKAYGACIYVRAWNDDKNIGTRLLCAKARVTPLNKQTLPRLELMGAVMLVRLMDSVKKTLKTYSVVTHYWTDSEIVLSWIHGSPQEWKTYVANRVVQIRELSKPEQWHHVRSNENPADILSRGTSAETFYKNSLWWEGPPWLRENRSSWQLWKNCQQVTPERKRITYSLGAITDSLNLIERFSSWRRLLRVTAYIFRFGKNCDPNCKVKKLQELSVQEIERAKIYLIKIAQGMEFNMEIDRLKVNKQVHRSSKLLPLAPYLDQHGVLRVGGRLMHANIPKTQRHPIILPYKNRLTQLIIEDFHRKNYHIGPNALLTTVRMEYWPLNGKSAAKAVVHSCVKCRKAVPTPLKPMMATLPAERVMIGKPFQTSGVDFCGPIWIKVGNKKSVKRKAYIALFICFVVKAVHLELVSDLTSDAFLAALKRFFSRRGTSRHIYSDNGTNFVGAQRELKFFVTDKAIQTECANVGTEWHFIPPGSPHFGGIWEASVKSLKLHMRKSLDKMVMTFEETSTVLAGIEACLNSRPLTSLSDNPDDPLPLTPAHFLIGGPLLLPPDSDLPNSITLRKRWHRVRKITQEFWQQWSREYLSSLQQRNKWRVEKANIPIGTLVTIKDENLKPTEWMMGKIKTLHFGTDGIARVATITLGQGKEIKRPLVKVCPILFYEDKNK